MKQKPFQKLLDDIRPMPWPKKLDHIWYYYRPHLVLGLLLFGTILSLVLTVAMKKDTVFCGVLANANVTDTGHQYLTEAFEPQLNVGPGEQIQLSYTAFGLLDETEDLEADYNAVLAIVTMVEVAELDYLIMDDAAVKNLVVYDMFMDLREFFTPQELEQLSGKLKYAQPEGAPEAYPVVVDLAGTPFFEDCVQGQEHLYIGFLGNTQNKESCKALWQHILAWEENKKES